GWRRERRALEQRDRVGAQHAALARRCGGCCYERPRHVDRSEHVEYSDHGCGRKLPHDARLSRYDVYVYADGDNRTYTRTADYTISGTGISTKTVRLTDTGNTNYAGTYAEARTSAGNYVKFTFTGDGFTVTATPISGSTTSRRAPVNGIQIVPR